MLSCSLQGHQQCHFPCQSNSRVASGHTKRIDQFQRISFSWRGNGTGISQYDNNRLTVYGTEQSIASVDEFFRTTQNYPKGLQIMLIGR